MTTTAAPATNRRRTTTNTTTSARRLKKPATVQKPKHDESVVRVPDSLYEEIYIGRTIHGVEDFDAAMMAFETGSNILVEGPTGPGKTTFFNALGAKYKMPMYSMPSGNNADASQIFGRFIPDGKGGWEWKDGPATQIFRYGGILYVNELNLLPPGVASILYEATDRRRQLTLTDKDGEVVRAHRPTVKDRTGKAIQKCWCKYPADTELCRPLWVLIVADLNPGYEGTRPLSKAIQNRFKHKWFWDYDPNVESTLVYSPALLKMASDLRVQIAARRYNTPVSTNMLQEFEDNLLTFNKDYAVGSFVNAFPEIDRSSVEMVVKTYIDNIETDLKAAPAPGLPDFRKMTEDEIYQWRIALKPGEVDPKWGIYMTDWEWEE